MCALSQKNGWLIWTRNQTWRLFLPEGSGGRRAQADVPFGSNRIRIPVTKHPARQGELSFPVQCMARGSGKRLTPLIGILTSRRTNARDFRGNKENFRDIIATGRRLRTLVFVFTPQDVHKNSQYVTGFTRHPAVSGWLPLSLPRPHVVYNRIPDRKAEAQPAERNTLRYFLSHPETDVFNPRFFNKNELFDWLAQDDTLKPHLPTTHLWHPTQSRDTLAQLMQRHQTLYIKPVTGRAGKGIIRVKRRTGGYDLTHVTGKGQQLKTTRTRRLHEVHDTIQALAGKEQYLVQQGIELARYRGRPFDLRLLVQKDKDARWRVTGAGIRIAGENGITTHVPRGGKIGNPHTVLPEVFTSRAKTVYRQAHALALKAAHSIERHSGMTLGEISLDLGADRDRRLWVFEANAKPMKFDEPLIRRRSLERIIEYANYLAEGRQQLAHP